MLIEEADSQGRSSTTVCERHTLVEASCIWPFTFSLMHGHQDIVAGHITILAYPDVESTLCTALCRFRVR